MGEEIAFENGRISDFPGLVTLTLTLDRVILHTVMHPTSTSTYVPNFIEIEETFCGQSDVRRYGRIFETHFIRSTRRSRPHKPEHGLRRPRVETTTTRRPAVTLNLQNLTTSPVGASGYFL